jgi:hypothetical protein
VGYLEEEAVITYTDILELLDAGKLPMWSTMPAPRMAVGYWRLAENATMRNTPVFLIKETKVNEDSGCGNNRKGTDKKEKKIFPICKEIQMGAVAKSYNANIYSHRRRPLFIYDFATAPYWISLFMRKIWFSFL